MNLLPLVFLLIADCFNEKKYCTVLLYHFNKNLCALLKIFCPNGREKNCMYPLS